MCCVFTDFLANFSMRHSWRVDEVFSHSLTVRGPPLSVYIDLNVMCILNFFCDRGFTTQLYKLNIDSVATSVFNRLDIHRP